MLVYILLYLKSSVLDEFDPLKRMHFSNAVQNQVASSLGIPIEKTKLEWHGNKDIKANTLNVYIAFTATGEFHPTWQQATDTSKELGKRIIHFHPLSGIRKVKVDVFRIEPIAEEIARSHKK